MNQQFKRLESEEVELDVAAIAAKLDRIDVLLLRQFYYVRGSSSRSTAPQILKLLVDKLQRDAGLVGTTLSYSAIRRRLNNLVALGLLKEMAHTNPKSYWPHDHLVGQVRRLIFYFAAELVGLTGAGEGR